VTRDEIEIAESKKRSIVEKNVKIFRVAQSRITKSEMKRNK